MIGPALVDANVLFPQLLRDVLVSLAASRAFHARWTNQIHDEWTRNVHKQRPDISLEMLHRVRALMNDNVPDCLVEDYEPLIESLQLPDANDRHVLAAAIRSSSRFIVTLNLKDFPTQTLAPHEITALSPDEFLCLVFADECELTLAALSKQRRRFRKPSLSADEFLSELKRQSLPRFALELESFKLAL
jgi:predicted nucleic acid-binding protein